MSDEIAIISTEQMKSLIYEIRGQKVMLDKDLAKIYGYETKNFNRQVKNNIEKFPDDFMFQLTYDEALRCNFFTLNKTAICGGNISSIYHMRLPNRESIC
jgi:hypothetical protein